VGAGGAAPAPPARITHHLRELRLSNNLSRMGAGELIWLLPSCSRLTAVDVVVDRPFRAVSMLREVPAALRTLTSLCALTLRAAPGVQKLGGRGLGAGAFASAHLARLTRLTRLELSNLGLRKLDVSGPRGAPPNLAALRVLDLRGCRFEGMPPSLRHAAPGLVVLKLGWPEWGALPATARDRRVALERGRDLGEAGRAAAVRGRFDLAELAVPTRPLPASLEELHVSNAHLDLGATPRVPEAQRRTPARLARAVALTCAADTAPGLRLVLFTNVSTANEAVQAMFADRGAVLRAAYTPPRGGESPVRVVGQVVWAPPPPPQVEGEGEGEEEEEEEAPAVEAPPPDPRDNFPEDCRVQ
jgi:hypothetical protein